MSTLADLRPRRDYALARSFLLALAVHVILIAMMFLGVSWQSHPAETVAVELWEPPPPVVETPKPPPPKVEPPKPKPEPEPEVKKPEIVEKVVPPKPKPKPEPKPEPKPKPAPPKVDEYQKRMAREQLAMEQRRLDEERHKADAERLARELAQKGQDRALSEYQDRIRRKVRQNWILPPDLQGNPEAIFNVVQLPTGEVISARLARSSGNAAYDAAVERAILKSSPLPLPEPRSLFQRELKLTFRPRD